MLFNQMQNIQGGMRDIFSFIDFFFFYTYVLLSSLWMVKISVSANYVFQSATAYFKDHTVREIYHAMSVPVCYTYL